MDLVTWQSMTKLVIPPNFRTQDEKICQQIKGPRKMCITVYGSVGLTAMHMPFICKFYKCLPFSRYFHLSFCLQLFHVLISRGWYPFYWSTIITLVAWDLWAQGLAVKQETLALNKWQTRSGLQLFHVLISRGWYPFYWSTIITLVAWDLWAQGIAVKQETLALNKWASNAFYFCAFIR